MDYRMISIVAAPDENVIKLIHKELTEQKQIKVDKLVLKFIGFEAESGTEFYLNKQTTPIKVPSTGNFITPYNGERYMDIYNLSFPEGFSGDLYYIV